MKTDIIKLSYKNQQKVAERGAEVIRSGGLVVFPTETVYGLGANALDGQAVKKIFIAKGRPSDNPIIVHIATLSQLEQLAKNISPLEQKIIKEFWPGPLTIILKKHKDISSVVSGGLSTIAVRMPAHSFARNLIRKSGVPIAAPSANLSGRPSGTLGEHLALDLSGKVDVIVDAGPTKIGLESTVIKVTGNKVQILRPGAVTEEMLQKIVSPAKVSITKNKKTLSLSPGTKYKHYAPKAKLKIIYSREEKMGPEMLKQLLVFKKKKIKVGIICTSKNKKYFKSESSLFVLGDRNNSKTISRNLFKALRFFDTHKVDLILCESFPKKGLGVAIMDRLERAAGEHH